MAELYTNLNTVTLYKTPKFNIIDSVMFSSATERDNYFNSFSGTDKIELTEFTDLYEGRSIVLPYNYLDLKEYNTMKLYYNDGLGHTETYYCNVDNYIYVSTDACVPLYRIDYFLTFSYMLYNKNIAMVTDRRTVAENSLTKDMKADAMVVPRLKYEKKPTYFTYFNETIKAPYYIVYLNKTTGGVGKLGINCKMELPLNTGQYYEIDTYTIGCYVAIADKDHLSTILNNEPLEYIEKVIEVDTSMGYLHTTDYTSLTSNGYVYLTNDITYSDHPNNLYYYSKVNLYNESTINAYDDIGNFSTADRVNLYPNHKKKILKWQPTTGIVIQGMEYDLKDFDDRDFPTLPGVTNFGFLYSSIYFFNFLGYTFAYPLGYKHEAVNMDYMIKWQSGRNFEYSCDYTKSLAYKELQEYNSRAIRFANQQASLQTSYNNKMLSNYKEIYDTTQNQSAKSYQAQLETINTQMDGIKEQNYSPVGIANNIFGTVGNAVQGNYVASAGNLFQALSGYNTAETNLNLLRIQKSSLIDQYMGESRIRLFQYLQSVADIQYQNDSIALARDNAIANISISNKYNNAKPNAYYETDFTQFTSYYYMYYIDLTDGDQIEQNIKNRYNVLGTYVGYLETWKPSVYEGLYFDYIKGSVVNNSDEVSKGIPNEIYIELITRIEKGVRIWHPGQLAWFGNLIIDNTNLGTPEPYNTYTDDLKADLQDEFERQAYVSLEDKPFVKQYLKSYFTGLISDSYIDWFVDNQPWGTQTIPADRQNKIQIYETFIWYDHTEEETKQILIDADFLTVYEKQWILPQVS